MTVLNSFVHRPFTFTPIPCTDNPDKAGTICEVHRENTSSFFVRCNAEISPLLLIVIEVFGDDTLFINNGALGLVKCWAEFLQILNILGLIPSETEFTFMTDDVS